MMAKAQQKITPEELFKALKVVGRFADKSNGYFEVWDDNEVILRNVKGDNSLVFLDLSEETPETLIAKLEPHLL